MEDNKIYTTKELEAIKCSLDVLKNIREDAAMYEHCLNCNAIYNALDNALQTIEKILNGEEE